MISLLIIELYFALTIYIVVANSNASKYHIPIAYSSYKQPMQFTATLRMANGT